MSGFFSLNGRIMRETESTSSPFDRGLLLGDGLFETLRVFRNRIRHLDRHYDRFAHGCHVLRLPLPEKTQIADSLNKVITANLSGATPDTGHAALRLTYTRGPGPRGLAPPPRPYPTLLVTFSPLPAEQTPLDKIKPVALFISQHIFRDASSPLSSVKSLSMLPSLLARYEAQDHGADEALLCNHQGNIAEGSAANFLAFVKGKILTPPQQSGALPGISRARLLEAGFCEEAPLSPHHIPEIEGAWLVSALSLIPVASINSQKIPVQPETGQKIAEFLFAE